MDNFVVNFGNDIGDNFMGNVRNNLSTIVGTVLRTVLRSILWTKLRTIFGTTWRKYGVQFCSQFRGQFFEQFIHLFFLILSGIRTECPSGTKCVAEFFCNENAIMVAYRVNLTPAQKKQRGSLTVSFSNIDINELTRVSHHFLKSPIIHIS